MRSISFVSANYVGRALNYPGGSVSDWGKFDAATLEQDPARHVPPIVADVVKAGFKNIDLWTAHCHWQRHGAAAADAVKRICNDMETEFRAGRFEAGVLRGISEITDLLAAHFPPGGPHRNELPDKPLVI